MTDGVSENTLSESLTNDSEPSSFRHFSGKMKKREKLMILLHKRRGKKALKKKFLLNNVKQKIGRKFISKVFEKNDIFLQRVLVSIKV